MVELKRAEAKFLLSCVTSFAGEFERGVAAILAQELPGVEPPEVRELREQLQLLQRQLESRQSTVRVHEAMVGLIKCILASERRRVAERLDRPLSKATAPGVVKALQAQVLRYDAYMAREPLASARAQRILARANAAKAFAKATRKGGIAVAQAPSWEPALVEPAG